MKITIKALLINETSEQREIIDNMMLVFCTAIRYSFKRLIDKSYLSELESKKRIQMLEKEVSAKYNLNIRQSKDAVESARQTIESQKKLLQENYSNYESKVKAIEKLLKDEKLSEKKRKGLISKLEKRIRKLLYYKNFIDNETIPSVIFGTKQMFLKRCKGLISNKEWKDCRNNRVYSRGDRTKNGNPNLRVIIKNDMSYLEISTLEKTATNRAVKIQVPLYLPQKLSKKTGEVNGIKYREIFLDHLKTGNAYQVEIIKKNGKYYCHITFDLTNENIKYIKENGLIGIDTNPDGLALTMIDIDGNYRWHTYLKQHELLYARSNRRENLCGELVKQVILIAKTYNVGISVENLKFKNDKDVGSKFARIKHNFIYSKLLEMLESACKREGIELIKVHPAYTSKIGLYKYCHQYGMDVHNGAAMVIGRRAYGYKEKVPKLLKERYIENKEKFEKSNEWKQWSEIEKNIKKKVEVKIPAFWIVNRKKILGLVS